MLVCHVTRPVVEGADVEEVCDVELSVWTGRYRPQDLRLRGNKIVTHSRNNASTNNKKRVQKM